MKNISNLIITDNENTKQLLKDLNIKEKEWNRFKKSIFTFNNKSTMIRVPDIDNATMNESLLLFKQICSCNDYSDNEIIAILSLSTDEFKKCFSVLQ